MDSGIPVIRKLATKSFSRPSLNYKSSVDEESNWEEEGVGIAFGRYEFGGYNLFPASNHFTKARKAGQILDLEKISIFIGDSSIQQALLSYGVPELEINSFLDMISSTGGLEDELSSFGIDNKERVVQGLVERVANLCVVYSQIRNVKDIVLDSEYVCKNGLKGRWWEWNNPSEVHTYLDLKSQADKLVSEVKSLMNDSREVGFENIPFINGECIGFPSKVETRAYFRFVTENILFPLKEDLFELNKYINQNKNRVNQS